MDFNNLEYPFLEEVCSPSELHKVDLVFVHGLNPKGRKQHPFETWTHENGVFWPTAFLGEDFPSARILVYGYNSSVTNPEFMSTARIKDHAENLLNLLALERQGQSSAKIVFVGHSLGGLVIKQALFNAHQNPQYTKLRTATYGLVFFGCPHHGAKGVELGNVAAKVAKFVSNGSASNELLDCLKHNSFFTREMSENFKYQLEQYMVVSFFETKPMQLGGFGPASVGHVVVERDSAVLGIGSREFVVPLDADHSAMCKIGTRGQRYKHVKGNIKTLVDGALVSMQGFVPPPTMVGNAPPLPPRFSPAGAPPYAGTPPVQPTPKVTGVEYTPSGNDPKSILIAEHKNKGRWEQAKQLEQQVFQEHHSTLGAEHHSTLTAAHDLAATQLSMGFIEDSSKWSNWVASTCRHFLGVEHRLTMKADSLASEVMQDLGQRQESDVACATVFARQQDCLGDNDLDTLETQRRLAYIRHESGQTKDALTRLQKRTDTLKGLLGDTHILVFKSVLDFIEVMLPSAFGDTLNTARFSNEVQQASTIMTPVYAELRAALGPKNKLTIRALRILGTIKLLEGETTEASDNLRRALSNSEELLGRDHPETLSCVVMIGCLAGKGNGVSYNGQMSSEMRPWLERYLDWTERRKGKAHPEAKATLQLLANSYFVGKDYGKAEDYFERLSLVSGGDTSQEAQQNSSMLQLCKMSNRYLTPRPSGATASVTDFLSRLKF
ncbi:NB-ARC domain-containing protein [Phlyctema vagabunda]|uniref:NB-ARC domain-containing protein n=1 Tax=Phlyctema vagabunda TaxID=108571 RepID=A0ABR4P2F2_9HELO